MEESGLRCTDAQHCSRGGSVAVLLISVCPLYRYDFGINKHAVQLSNCYFAAWKWCELYGYNHAWYNGGFCFFGEERFHVKIVENLKIGAILNITHFGTWDAYVSVGIRYDL